MKRLYSLFLVVCVLVLHAHVAVAQITITAADVTTQLGVGNVLTNITDTLTTSADIGAPGSTSWDFSGLLSHTSTVLTSVSPAGSPFIADFPTATHTLKSSLSGFFAGFPGAVTGDLYLYLVLGTNLVSPGSKGSGTITLPPFGTIPGTLTITNTPADITYALPLTLGTTWSITDSTNTAIVLSNVPFSSSTIGHNISYEVDAFGPMTIPGGGVHDALRIRKMERAGTGTFGYIFIAKNGAMVQLNAIDTLQANSGVIPVARSSITWSAPTFVLPIQLSYFNAALDPSSSSVVVHWKTLSELNNFGFEIQKAPALSGEFKTIVNGFIAGHGTTNIPQEYSSVDMNVTGGAWYYRLRQIDLNGTSTVTEPVRVDVTTGVTEAPAPTVFQLSQNYPNPFNPSTVIRYGLPNRTHVSLVIYNSLGQEEATLVNGDMDAGYHDVKFDGSGLSSGVYFYRLQAGTFVETRKLTLIK